MPKLTRARVALAGLAVAAAVSGLLLGRATAGSGPAEPSLAPARPSAAAAALPQLSQAAPLPSLRPRPQPKQVVRRVRVPVRVRVPTPPPRVRTVVTTVQTPGKKKPQRAVRITGSG